MLKYKEITLPSPPDPGPPSPSLRSRTQDQSDFPGLSRSWNFKEKNPGLSRRRGDPAGNVSPMATNVVVVGVHVVIRFSIP